jgi:crotonobetainyl-CoA:carnitine CoA-transferase CaiB-like acyl-CoA transferase
MAYLNGRYDVDGLATSVVRAALDTAADLAQARGGPRPRVALDAAHVACAFASERHLRRGGSGLGPGFAPLSRFAPTRDGWIRLHANYDHHRRALLAALGTDEEGALGAIAERGGEELEDAIVAAGGAAAAVRSPEAWSAHPQGRAAAALPLVQALPAARAEPRALGAGALPASGVRVLDLTRVIAGPVATRFLAALGADVLRLDPPHMPELELGLLDTCVGKRLAALDLRATPVEDLLRDADVVVAGYRPGALAAFGLDDAQLADRHPHLVVASLSAWGRTGPWAQRRGFDSLVQAACGIAWAQGRDGAPGALPVQALDHATGYLLAGAVLGELAARRRGEAPRNLRLALAATAADLMRRPGDGAAAQPACDDFRLQLGELSVIAPPGALDGRPLAWERPAEAAPARWR